MLVKFKCRDETLSVNPEAVSSVGQYGFASTSKVKIYMTNGTVLHADGTVDSITDALNGKVTKAKTKAAPQAPMKRVAKRSK